MIRLGLQRITHLLKDIDLSWRAIHVAGTNGKGSICGYLTSMLKAADIHSGTFTSPHLIDRWDCIAIDGKPISEQIFREVEDQVLFRNRKDAIGASEFELLTCTAYEIFNREKVNVGIVECGMGGLEDATNTLEKPLATVISTVGLDHEKFLGPTIRDIAFHKAGIIKPGSPCIVSKQPPEAVESIQSVAYEKLGTSAGLIHVFGDDSLRNLSGNFGEQMRSVHLSDIKKSNMWCAYQAMAVSLPHLVITSTRTSELLDKCALTMFDLNVAARQQSISLSPIMRDSLPERDVLLDGAHNLDSWRALADHLGRTEEDHTASETKLTWVIACTQGKSIENLANSLLRDGDNVIVVKYGLVDGMPWVKAMDTGDILTSLHNNMRSRGGWVSVTEFAGSDQRNLLSALREAYRVGGDSRIVIAGSLYLASDVLRLLRDIERAGGIDKFEAELEGVDGETRI